MEVFTLIIIAISLSMDSFAVSVSNGIMFPHLTRKKLVLIAVCFAVFQGAMPLLGWILGHAFIHQIEFIDHWIAFGLLSLIGGKMIYESVSNDSDEEIKDLNIFTVVAQAIATSIDALAVGISFAALKINIVHAVGIIALTTLVVSLFGLKMGRVVGNKLSHRAELVGGVVLIALGVKILLDHILF